MKIHALLLSSIVLTAAPIDNHDRDRILSELHASRKMFLDSVAGVTHDQWVYKAGPDRWSIQEVAEHIAAADPFILGVIQKQLMETPAKPELAAKRSSTNAQSNEAVLKGVTNRSQKLQAPEPLKPKDIYNNAQDAVGAFNKAREITLDYVRATKADLREHFLPGPTGNEMDGVHWLLLLAGHTERHVAQILEVKESANYPKH